jgi:hypothetical protein
VIKWKFVSVRVFKRWGFFFFFFFLRGRISTQPEEGSLVRATIVTEWDLIRAK